MVVETVLKTSSLIGTEVANPSGESLGKVDELIVDLEFGVIAYAVVAYGGFLGMGNKWFIVPWAAFTPSNSEDKLVLNVHEDTFKADEGFDKDAMPEMDRNWGQSIHAQYGQTPYWLR